MSQEFGENFHQICQSAKFYLERRLDALFHVFPIKNKLVDCSSNSEYSLFSQMAFINTVFPSYVPHSLLHNYHRPLTTGGVQLVEI